MLKVSERTLLVVLVSQRCMPVMLPPFVFLATRIGTTQSAPVQSPTKSWNMRASQMVELLTWFTIVGITSSWMIVLTVSFNIVYLD
jgi:hypothetical protein